MNIIISISKTIHPPISLCCVHKIFSFSSILYFFLSIFWFFDVSFEMSAPFSPKNRMKFLCSHGGKILPRPADGHLKYVGGETRVISVPRDITFHDLMKKLTAPIEGDMVLKYQLVPEDLDSLVSVKSDEDLRHMIDEYNRCETSAGVPRLRTFLFPAKPIVLDHPASTSEPLEQRYIDAVNGIIRATEVGSFRLHPPPGVSHASFGISSACSSPRSPESCTTEGVNQEHFIQSNYHNRGHMPKVHSSPSICSLASQQQRQGLHNYKPSVYHSYQFGKPPPADPVKGPERLISNRSVGRVEGIRYHVDHSPHYYNSTTRHNRGSGYCMRCMHYDDSGHFGERGGNRSPSGYSIDKRNGSFCSSPHSLSPIARSTNS